MGNVRLSWEYPTVTTRQRPHKAVRLSARVSDTLPWTSIATVDAPGTELLLEDVAPGTWFYRAILEDDQGKLSDPVFADTAMEYDAPSPLSLFAAAPE